MRSFISLCKRFLQLVESLETVSRLEIATLQHLEGFYIRKMFAKQFEKSEQILYTKISVY